MKSILRIHQILFVLRPKLLSVIVYCSEFLTGNYLELRSFLTRALYALECGNRLIL